MKFIQAIIDFAAAAASIATRRLAPIAPTVAPTEEPTFKPTDEIVTAPYYDPAQCDSWIGALPAFDVDSSGGLSGEEYYSFLAGIKNPPYAGAYIKEFPYYDKLPWTFRVIHKALACHCEQIMDMEPSCCEGDRAEIQVLGLTGDTTQEKEYRNMFCEQIAYAFSKWVPMPESPTPGPTNNDGICTCKEYTWKYMGHYCGHTGTCNDTDNEDIFATADQCCNAFRDYNPKFDRCLEISNDLYNCE